MQKIESGPYRTGYGKEYKHEKEDIEAFRRAMIKWNYLTVDESILSQLYYLTLNLHRHPIDPNANSCASMASKFVRFCEENVGKFKRIGEKSVKQDEDKKVNRFFDLVEEMEKQWDIITNAEYDYDDIDKAVMSIQNNFPELIKIVKELALGDKNGLE